MSEKHESKEQHKKETSKETKNENVHDITRVLEELMQWFLDHKELAKV